MARVMIRAGLVGMAGIIMLLVATQLLGATMLNLERTCNVVNDFVDDSAGQPTFFEYESPDSQYRLYGHQSGTFIHDAQTGQIFQLRNQGYDGQQLWSPARNQLIVFLRCDILAGRTRYFYRQHNILALYDFTDGLTQYRMHPAEARLTYWNEFLGWSPDGNYYATQTQLNSLEVWSVADGAQVYHQPRPVWGRELWWSPDGHSLAYLIDENTPRLVMADLNSDREQIHSLPADYGFCGYPRTAIWSPDGAALVHLHSLCANYESQLDYYAWDGSATFNLTRNLFQFSPYVNPEDAIPVIWSADSQQIYFWETGEFGSHRFKQYDVSRNAARLLLDMERPPFFPIDYRQRPFKRNGDQMALYHVFGDSTYSIELTDLYGTAPIPFVEHADDLGNPYWHDDGDLVAAVYAEETPTDRIVRVAWMNADGSDYHEYENRDYIDFIDLLWSPDGSELLFMGVHDDLRFDALLIDTDAEEVVVLKERLALRDRVSFDDEVAFVQFLWYDETHMEWGYTAFDRAGNTLYELVDRRLNGWINQVHAFWSPDKQTVALKINNSAGEALLVTQPNLGRNIVLSDGLSGLGDPVWSETSDSVYFTESRNRGPVVGRTFFMRPDDSSTAGLNPVEQP